MIYYIADMHFGHANIIKYCNRPFKSVEEMDSVLVRNWQKRVKEDDTVYIVGDIIYGHKNPEVILEQLPGKKILIEGNHDRSWKKKVDVEKYFEDIELMAEIKDNGIRVVLCHYPLMTWFEFGKGTYHVYGHIHDNINVPYWSLLMEMEDALNAGADINNFYPVTLEELIENNRIFKSNSK